MATTCPHCGIRVRPTARRCPQCDGAVFGGDPAAEGGWSLGDQAGPAEAGATGGDPAGGGQASGDPASTTWGEPTGGGSAGDPWSSGQVPPWTPGGPGADWGAGGRPPPLTSSERDLGLLAHLSAFVTFVGIPSFVGPLVVWLWKRDAHPFVADQAREALNFNLSVFLYGVVGFLMGVALGIVTLGIGLLVLVPAAIAFGVAFCVLVVVAAMRASKGERYRYPLTIRFVS